MKRSSPLLVNNHLNCLHQWQNPGESSAGKEICARFSMAKCARVILILFIGSIYLFEPVIAQNNTDTITSPKHSARKATYYSMALPGLGQAYNHKYWKIPVIYAGFGAFAYFIHKNNKKYIDFKEAYRWKVGTADSANKPYSNPYVDRYDATQLKEGQDYYRRNLEVSIIFTAVLYILNVVDASVDAHFFDYSINEDLSLRIDPFVNPPSVATKQGGGFKITLSF
ncbi:MAG: DUF5683 domain-containing protein [Bacteroidota bacterium]